MRSLIKMEIGKSLQTNSQDHSLKEEQKRNQIFTHQTTRNHHKIQSMFGTLLITQRDPKGKTNNIWKLKLEKYVNLIANLNVLRKGFRKY